MKTDSQLHAKDYINELAASGRYHFTSGEAREALGVSADATKLALNRLTRQDLIASPSRGFYVIIPPEYRSLGCLPADQFIPALMKHARQSYYVGLLSAAQYYGAAHQRPQEYQVLLSKARRPIQCGKVRVAFVVRKRLEEVPVQDFNTPRGTIQVSTPEATAIDLVGYPDRIGGLDQAATVLSELAEKIDPDKLAAAARTAPVPWAQRLGHLFEQVSESNKTQALKAYVKENARQSVLLLSGGPQNKTQHDRDWKVFVNAVVEAEF